jgi:hypothetical protein
MTSIAQKYMLTDHGGFPIGYVLQAWPSARSPQFFINASNTYYLTFEHE